MINRSAREAMLYFVLISWYWPGVDDVLPCGARIAAISEGKQFALEKFQEHVERARNGLPDVPCNADSFADDIDYISYSKILRQETIIGLEGRVTTITLQGVNRDRVGAVQLLPWGSLEVA